MIRCLSAVVVLGWFLVWAWRLRHDETRRHTFDAERMSEGWLKTHAPRWKVWQ